MSKDGYFVIDIERTGHGYKNDKTFGIGWAHSDKHLTNIVKGNVCMHLWFSNKYCEDIDVMRTLWLSKNFEQRCFEEFWSKHLDIFGMLQDETKVNLVADEYSMAQALNNALLEAESMYDNLMIVCDTIMFDTTWCNLLLMKHGFKGLSWSRSGKYRWGYELDSYTLGSLGFTPEVDWKDYSKAIETNIDVIFPDIQINHDHNPENDAMSILVKFIRVVNYNEKK